MKPIAYCVYREDEFIVAQCLNVDVASFGSNREEAVANLKEVWNSTSRANLATATLPSVKVAVGQEMVNA